MDYDKPTLLIISGPNGAGKSTHIQDMLPLELESIRSFNRDLKKTEYEKTLGLEGIPEKLIPHQAVGMMEEKLLEEMSHAARNKEHFVLETPLSHPDYWMYIDHFTNHGYQVQLYYLCLDNYHDSLDRVRLRVTMGGHDVPPNTIKSVYEDNLKFINEFKDTFSSIELYDGMKFPKLLAKMENNQVIYVQDNPLEKAWIKKGLPFIAKKILDYQQTNRNLEKAINNSVKSNTVNRKPKRRSL